MHSRADFAESDNIEALLLWSHPHIKASGDFQFTETEKLVMLNLPRVECKTHLPS